MMPSNVTCDFTHDYIDINAITGTNMIKYNLKCNNNHELKVGF